MAVVMNANQWKRERLRELIELLHSVEKNCRDIHTEDALHGVAQDLVACHTAAALIYETELSRMREMPTLPPET